MSIWTPEHEQLRQTVARFIVTEIDPHADRWEQEGRFPAHELFKKAGALGLLGITKPVAWGGLGLDYSYAVVWAEELGRAACAGVPLALGVQSDMCTPALARFGSDELKRDFLAPSIAGELVGAIAVSEPHAGSDVARIRTRAVRDGDDLIVSGSKLWITNGMQADWFCALVVTGGPDPHRDKSLVVIPGDAPGLSRPREIAKMGMRSSDTAAIFFDEVRIPKRYVIGEPGRGFNYQMLQFQEERLWGAANLLKFLESTIERTIEYTRERAVFGRALLDNQIVHFRLAELACEVEALRSLVYRATEAYVQGSDVTRLATMAKLKGGRLAREVTDACLQFWGGMGYAEDSFINRRYRDARLASIGAGADEVMLAILCKLAGTLPTAP